MDLYHKKVKIGTKANRKGKQGKYMEPEYNQEKPKQNIYLQKMMPQNENIDLKSTGDNVRSSMEDIFSNEDNKKKAIKYVINIGRNKNIRNSPNYQRARRLEKSASPNRGRRYPQEYGEIYEDTPNLRYPERRGDSHLNNRHTTSNDYNPKVYTGYNNSKNKKKYNDNNTAYKNNLRPNIRNYSQYNDGDTEEYYDDQPNYINIEESQNFEVSSIEDGRAPKRLRNVQPNIMNRVKNPLDDPYGRAPQRVRNKDVIAIPKVSKQPNYKQPKNFRNNDLNTDDEIDELIQTIEYLKSLNDRQKYKLKNLRKDNYQKDKEINLLKNDLENLEKELEDKRLEHDKEIDDIYKANNNRDLKNEYFKLLQDYDTNINDYNNLKDDYNKMVDEYNILKNEKNKLNDENKNLKQNNNKLKEDYNNIKSEANKALDDYNNVVDDYNKLEREIKKTKNNYDLVQNENDRLKKDYERLRNRNRGKQTEDKKEQEFNKLCDDYDKLNEDFNKVNNENNTLKNENEQLKEENEKLKKEVDNSHPPKDEDNENLYDALNKLKDDNENLKKENQELKNIFNNNNYNTMTPNRKLSQFEESPKANEEKEDPTKLQENYDKLKNYYKKLVDEYNKLKERDTKVKQEYNKLMDDFNKVYTDKYKSDYANILMNNENNKLKEENDKLKNDLSGNIY